MSTIKANNHSQACKELEAIEQGLSSKISSEVKEGNKNHFNVILVQRINDSVNERYITKLVPQAFSAEGYEKVKKQFQYLGYSKVVLLHDPNMKEVAKDDSAKDDKSKEKAEDSKK